MPEDRKNLKGRIRIPVRPEMQKEHGKVLLKQIYIMQKRNFQQILTWFNYLPSII